MRRIAATVMLVVGLVATSSPAGAYHSKVSLARTVEVSEGVWHTHLRISHWEPHKYVKVFVCSDWYDRLGIVACNEDAGLTTDRDGRVHYRFYLYAGETGSAGECNDRFDGCSVVVMTENPRDSRFRFKTAVRVPIVPS